MKKNKNCNINLLYASRNYQHADEAQKGRNELLTILWFTDNTIQKEHKTIETYQHTTM